MRGLRRALILIVVVGVAAAAAIIATARTDLQDALDEADRTWIVVAEPLGARYAQVEVLADTVSSASNAATELARETADAAAGWPSVVASGSTDDQVRAANELEGLTRRLVATSGASPRLAGDANVREAVDNFGQTPIPESGRAYNGAAADYEAERDGIVRGVAATVLGFDSLPLLDLPS